MVARAGQKVVVAAGAARDRYGNTNAAGVSFVAGTVTTDDHPNPFPPLDRTY